MSVQKSTLFAIVHWNGPLLTLQMCHVPTWFTGCNKTRETSYFIKGYQYQTKNDKDDDTHYCSHPSKRPALHFFSVPTPIINEVYWVLPGEYWVAKPWFTDWRKRRVRTCKKSSANVYKRVQLGFRLVILEISFVE